VKCKTCSDKKFLNYYGDIVLCADCSDDFTIFEIVNDQAKTIEKLKGALEWYAFPKVGGGGHYARLALKELEKKENK